jgi:hypothetical protein
MQIQGGPSGHNGESENHTVRAYKDKLDPCQKGIWLSNGVAMGAKVQSYA